MAKRIKRYQEKHVRKRRLKYKNIFITLIFIFVIGFGIVYLLYLPISNIYIINNQYLTDQEIIEYAGISDYPNNFKIISFSLENKLKNHPFIQRVKVTKKMFTNVYIEVAENRPLFYDSAQEKTVLLDGTLYNDELNVPFVINYIPDTIYSQFYERMKLVYPEVLDRISEIKYDPNDVDEERFLFFMKDENYVYVTISKFNNINNYIDIVKKFGNKKGILYLDSGEYFKILED